MVHYGDVVMLLQMTKVRKRLPIVAIAIMSRGCRIDVLEDSGRNTVCIYDPKTGDTDMRRKRLCLRLTLGDEAELQKCI